MCREVLCIKTISTTDGLNTVKYPAYKTTNGQTYGKWIAKGMFVPAKLVLFFFFASSVWCKLLCLGPDNSKSLSVCCQSWSGRFCFPRMAQNQCDALLLLWVNGVMFLFFFVCVFNYKIRITIATIIWIIPVFLWGTQVSSKVSVIHIPVLSDNWANPSKWW